LALTLEAAGSIGAGGSDGTGEQAAIAIAEASATPTGVIDRADRINRIDALAMAGLAAGRTVGIAASLMLLNLYRNVRRGSGSAADRVPERKLNRLRPEAQAAKDRSISEPQEAIGVPLRTDAEGFDAAVKGSLQQPRVAEFT
jgi:hypothetical protein